MTLRTPFVSAVFLLVATALAGCAQSPPAGPLGPVALNSPTTRPSAPSVLMPRNDLAGLPNFACVSPVLYRGAQPTAEGFAQLRKMGIKTVVNLRSWHDDREELRGTGLKYIQIACAAWNPDHDCMAEFLSIVRNPANQPVFVHCQHGADRTGCAVGAYRIAEQGWSVDDAVAELPRFNFHPIWGQIKTYLARFDAAEMRHRMVKVRSREFETMN